MNYLTPRSAPLLTLTLVVTLAGALLLPAQAQWPGWRGPDQTGASSATGVASTWSRVGEGLLWRVPFTGRSTPVVVDGRVCAVGRSGEGVTRQERTACYDALSGELLWEHRFNVFHTTIPFNRVGWSSPAADPETGNLYVHGVQGLLLCYDRDGRVLWSRSLTEEFGRISGYGGRVHTPVVDEDLVIISFLNASWGAQAVPRHRYFAFDKRSGEVVWISTPGGRPLDTTYSTPVVADIGGRRLLIGGNADGAVYGMEARTGRKVWGFGLSKRGLNVSVVVDGNRVYAAHSEENLDNNAMGRVVCIDGSGTGDVTTTHEVWRLDGCLVGYASPAVHGGRLYVVDNSANLHCLDAASGAEKWTQNVGRVGKGSPVWADGKLFVPEVNGTLQIIEVGDQAATVLDRDDITMPDGRPAEIYGSPAVGYGNVYFATEEGLYCLGTGDGGEQSSAASAAPPVVPSERPPSHIQIVPAEVLMSPGETVRFATRGFDDRGRPVRSVDMSVDVDWSLEGLSGELTGNEFTAPAGPATGHVRLARSGTMVSRARVRVVSSGDQTESFAELSAAPGSNPAPTHWIGAGGGKFSVIDVDGERVLMKRLAKRGLQRSNVYIGPPSMSAYTVQADVMGTQGKRNRPDAGLIAQRYTLDLMGNHQRLQVRSWAADLRMARTIDFPWEMDVWYTMKMRVDVEDGVAIVKGKVWERGTVEPAPWTITATDPLPNLTGSPGIYGYSAAPLYYDNVVVSRGD